MDFGMAEARLSWYFYWQNVFCLSDWLASWDEQPQAVRGQSSDIKSMTPRSCCTADGGSGLPGNIFGWRVSSTWTACLRGLSLGVDLERSSLGRKTASWFVNWYCGKPSVSECLSELSFIYLLGLSGGLSKSHEAGQSVTLTHLSSPFNKISVWWSKVHQVKLCLQ